MNTTFYGVLGVGPDADDDAIRAAYRERVKDHHPDVSAEPDAAEHFKRLTNAKEVLLDPKERSRYDRFGHASYVDAHGDASLWTVDQSPDEAESASATESATVRAGTEAKARPGSESESESDEDEAEGEEDSDQVGSRDTSRESRTGAGTRNRSRTAANRSRSATASKSRSKSSTAGDFSGAARSSRTADGAAAGSASDTGNGSARATANGSPTDTGPTATSSGSDPTATGRSSANSTESSAASGGSRSACRRDRTGGTAAAANERPGREASTAAAGSYARSSFWDATDGEVSDGRRVDPLSSRAVGVLRTLGVWLLVHMLFLSLAVGTGWYVYTVLLPPARRTLPLLFVLLGEVGLAVVLSSLHVLSRVYR